MADDALTRQQRRAAKRARARADRSPRSTPAQSIDSRQKAHAKAREIHGPDAARWVRAAATWVGIPSADFATLDAWRAFLEPLYPAWLIDAYAASLYESGRRVVAMPDRLDPYTGEQPLDLALLRAGLDAEGMWDPPVPAALPDRRPRAWQERPDNLGGSVTHGHKASCRYRLRRP